MKNTKEMYELTGMSEPTIEELMINIDEEKLPQIVNKRLHLLEKTNSAYKEAERKENEARNKVNQALRHADELIDKAKGAGKNTARTGRFFTRNANEIEAIKANLKEMIECGINSAEAQKELVRVQVALADCQTALLKVQETQMAYQRQIADATKFLYGLCAYNMGQTGSILFNLTAILQGAKKEKLGEMAEQQLMLVLDQIKSQENLILRIKENKKAIERLGLELSSYNAVVVDLQKADAEQDALIEGLQKADAEQDEQIEGLQKTDVEHDEKIEGLQKADAEQDALIEELQKTDAVYDEILKGHTEKDKEHDKILEELKKQDDQINNLIEQNVNYIKKLQEESQRLNEIKADKKMMYMSTGIAIISLFLAIIQFFI